MYAFLLPLLLLASAAAAQPAAAQDEMTLYRCTDADGRVAIQDFPCANDEQQQVRNMLRPQDPPPRPMDDATPAASPAREAPAINVIVRSPPRAMFECVTPDGERYLSDSGDGNPRPAPVWYPASPWATPGVAPGPRSSGERRASGIASPGMSTSPGPSLATPSQRQAAPPPRPRPGQPGRRHGRAGYGYDAGIIRDECHRLPQARVCSVLSDRRTELRRRMFNAQPSERAVLREEERDITARLNEDCDIR